MSDTTFLPANSTTDLNSQPGSRSFYFQWHILDNCNLRCKHCYQKGYKPKKIDLQEILNIANQIESALKQWQYLGRVAITGGEPLLQPEAVFTLLDFFSKSKNIEWVGILSNGTCINNDLAMRLSKYKILREVQVSLDGSTADVHDKVRGAGTFNRTLQGIEHLKSAGIKTAVMFTLTQHNIESAIDMIDLAIELGVNAVTVERATPTGPRCNIGDTIEPEQLQKVYTAIAEKKRNLNSSTITIRTSRPLWCLVDQKFGGFCPAGLTCMAILPDSTVLPCRRMEVPIGNILKDGIFKIWYTSEVLWNLRDKRKLAEGCNGCNMLEKCGGCRAIAYAMTGDYMGRDPQCFKHKLGKTNT